MNSYRTNPATKWCFLLSLVIIAACGGGGNASLAVNKNIAVKMSNSSTSAVEFIDPYGSYFYVSSGASVTETLVAELATNKSTEPWRFTVNDGTAHKLGEATYTWNLATIQASSGLDVTYGAGGVTFATVAKPASQ